MAEVKFRFKITCDDFYEEEFRSVYARGGVYTVHEGNDKLEKFARRLIAEGKAEVSEIVAKVAGVGTVSDGPEKQTVTSADVGKVSAEEILGGKSKSRR